MNKKKFSKVVWLIFLLFILLVCLVGCNNKSNLVEENISVINDDNKIEIKEIEFVKENNIDIEIDIDIEKILLSSIEGGEIFDICKYGEKIYYVVTYDTFNEYVNDLDIFCYDIENNTNYEIYKYSDVDKTFICELRVNNSYLFWTNIYPDYPYWSLSKMDLQSFEVTTIRKFSESLSMTFPILSVSENYVSWYELIDNGQDYSQNNLFIYSVKENTYKIISEDAYRSSPFNRAIIYSDKVVYTSINEEGFIVLHFYDMNTLTEMEYTTGDKNIVEYYFQNNLVIWKNDYYRGTVYIHDFNTGETIKMVDPAEGLDVYSIGIYDGRPWINFSNDYIGLNNIYFYDIDNKLAINMTNNDLDKRVFYLCTQLTADNKLIFHYYIEKDLYVGIID